MSLLISVLVFLVIAAVVWYVISLLPLPAPAKNIAAAILLIVFLIFILERSGLIRYVS